VLSVDSMQVYRGMDIGTAKPSAANRARITHHMVDIVDPEVRYTVAQFQRDAREVLRTAAEPVVISGGSGLHFRAVVDPLQFPPEDPELRARIAVLPAAEVEARLLEIDPEAGLHVDLANPRRVVRALEVALLEGRGPSGRADSPQRAAVNHYQSELSFSAVGIDPGPALRARVTARLRGMLDSGLLDEVGVLAPRLGPTAEAAVGYRQLLPVVRGERPLEVGVAMAEQATMRLARRQRTFFRRDPRIRWIRWSEDRDELYQAVRAALVEESAWTS
jgi:tRNA dimethylallyltransferase